MLWNEAIGLATRQEQSHGLFDSHRYQPLRQRMIDDMRMRKLEHKTQEALHPRRLQAGRLPRTLARHRHASKICGASSCTWSIRALRRSRSMRR